VLLIRASIQDGPATHGEVHRVRVSALRPAAFNIDEFNTEHPCKSVRDAEVVLEGQRALVDVHLFDPQMRAGARVDELRVDANGASHAAYAPLEHIPDTQLAANLPDIDGFTLECERSVPGDNKASSNSRQITCQVFSYAIGEVVLARIATQVAEGQRLASVDTALTDALGMWSWYIRTGCSMFLTCRSPTSSKVNDS